MKCKRLIKGITDYFLIICCALFSITCEETLPTYVAPQNVIGVRTTEVEQLNDHVAPPSSPLVRLVFVAENIHDEVFQDSVNIQGTVDIIWIRKPTRRRRLYISERDVVDRNLIRNGKMILVPGQQFSMEVYWDVRSDEGLSLLTEMNFARLTQRVCDFNVACADPEYFDINVTLNVFDRIGYVKAETREFRYVGRTCINCGIPPCPPPPGGCG